MDKLSLNAPVNTLFTSTHTTGSQKSSLSLSASSGNTTQALNLSSYTGGAINNAVLSSGGTSNGMMGGTLNSYVGYYWPFYEPYKEYHYHHWNQIPKPDKFETAFRLARKLMDKKVVKPLKTVEDFFKLMDTIVEAL